MSDSLSRLIRTRTSGVLSRRSVCRFCTPGYLRASSRKRSTSRCRSAYGICDMMTYSTGVERKENAADAKHHEPREHDHPARVQDGSERAPIAVRQCREPALDDIEEPRVLLLMAQKQRAHHRRQRQRNETGDEHRAGERERE